MKVLVVGGTGLIGGHAALELLAAGHEVTLMARKPPSTATWMDRCKSDSSISYNHV